MFLLDKKSGILTHIDSFWSLSFPFGPRKSRILPDSVTTLSDFVERRGEGITISISPKARHKVGVSGQPLCIFWERTRASFSKKFQWLPCNVDISSDDGNVR